MASAVRIFDHLGVRFCVYGTEQDMGAAAADAIAERQVSLASENGVVAVQVMAAPSAYAFYDAYAARAADDGALQAALGKTHFFQFDDYDLPRDHAASFCYLLEQHLYSRLTAWCPIEQIHFLCVHERDANEVCAAYTRDILALGPDLQLKGMGENGHWGFHEPGIPLEGDPAFIEVGLTPENARQQMRDHPELFPTEDAVPRSAFTANVPLFLRTRDAVHDCVPQPSKAFALLAAYGTDRVDACVPSSAAKRHANLTVHATEAAAWALEGYLDQGKVTDDDLRKMAGALTGEESSVSAIVTDLTATLSTLEFERD